MKVIVPLAGPDFITGESTKAERQVRGMPLLRLILESRPWWLDGQVSDMDLIFVLQNHRVSRRFKRDCLSVWYPSSRVVFLSHYTCGAALSALAAISLIDDFNEPICMDLADIYFECNLDPAKSTISGEHDAVALTFESDKAEYSYLLFDETGNFLESAEKRVISKRASAGVYLFADAPRYMSALTYLQTRGEKFLYNRLYFICPVLNGIKAFGGKVGEVPVTDVHDIKFAYNVT